MKKQSWSKYSLPIVSLIIFLVVFHIISSCGGGGSSSTTSDTSAPSAPSGLLATAVSSSQLSLTWSGSTDNTGVTGYKIYQGGSQLATTTTTSYLVSGLTASTHYCYTVSAYDAAANESTRSNQSCDTTGNTDYIGINVASGFSTAYLTGKTFYYPAAQLGDKNIIYVRQFTSRTVTWSENFYNTVGSANYTIVNANSINGIIQYNDGVYDLFFNVQSVMSDRIMVCYTYQGIASVKTCTIAEALPWYFDRSTAEASFP